MSKRVEFMEKYMWCDEVKKIMVDSYSTNRFKKIINRIRVMPSLLKKMSFWDNQLKNRWEKFTNNKNVVEFENGIKMRLHMIAFDSKRKKLGGGTISSKLFFILITSLRLMSCNI